MREDLREIAARIRASNMTPDPETRPTSDAVGAKVIEEWLTTTQAAERLGMTMDELYGLLDTCDIAAYRFGRVIRINAREVERYRDDGGGAGVPAEV